LAKGLLRFHESCYLTRQR